MTRAQAVGEVFDGCLILATGPNPRFGKGTAPAARVWNGCGFQRQAFRVGDSSQPLKEFRNQKRGWTIRPPSFFVTLVTVKTKQRLDAAAQQAATPRMKGEIYDSALLCAVVLLGGNLCWK